MNIFKLIFEGRELTCVNGGAILNKWREPYCKEPSIDLTAYVANYLIINDVLVLDSGNFETGEEHYTCTRDIDVLKNCEIGIQSANNSCIYNELKGVLRELNLSKLIL